ncbi:MAG TPA: hypothetical protein DCY79_09440 [Planctomycetaceae bacterium]|nr:hypothetical protein [Planctomycetaceae bacterium]
MLVYVAAIAVMFFLFFWLRSMVGPPYRSPSWRKRWARLLEDDERGEDQGGEPGMAGPAEETTERSDGES